RVAIVRRVVQLDEGADIDLLLPQRALESLPRRCGPRGVGHLRCDRAHVVLPWAAPAVTGLRNPSRSPVCRAIISSSFVGITQADTRLPDFEIREPWLSLAAVSNSTPSHADASQIRRRISAECSP